MKTTVEEIRDECVPAFEDLPDLEQADIALAGAKATAAITERLGMKLTEAEVDMFFIGWVGSTVATIEFCRAEQEGG